MNNKKLMIAIISATALIFFIELFLVMLNMKNEEKREKRTKEEIITYYEDFKKNTDNYQELKDEIDKMVINDLFEETVIEDYNNWVKELTNYKNYVDETINKGSNLEKYCAGKVYTEQLLNDYCNAYKTNYKTITQIFIKDIDTYNTFIENYLKTNKNTDDKIKLFEIDKNLYTN